MNELLEPGVFLCRLTSIDNVRKCSAQCDTQFPSEVPTNGTPVERKANQEIKRRESTFLVSLESETR